MVRCGMEMDTDKEKGDHLVGFGFFSGHFLEDLLNHSQDHFKIIRTKGPIKFAPVTCTNFFFEASTKF